MRNSLSRNGVTTVSLEGGIGNQLFQYVAGLYISLEVGTNLVLNVSRVTGNRHSGHCITDFDLPGVWEIESSSNQPLIDNFLTRDFRYWNHFGKKKFKILYETNPDFRSKLDNFKANRGISGYFQSAEYLIQLEKCGLFLQELELLNPSEDYLRLARESQALAPIVMHVRRGDYVAHKNNFGILNTKYYETAIASLMRKSQGRQIWIYSDDFPQVKEEFSDFPYKSMVRFMEETSHMAPAEVMKLMSFGSASVIANSTFSWWSAYFRNSGKEVVAPDPWFRNKRFSYSLIHPTWQKCPSEWT